MSKCISSHGEYSEHQLTNPNEPFTCQWCWVFDEEAAMRTINAVRALVESPEAVQYRDEACRHVVEQPYADNRYVRLLDAIREVLR